MGTFVVGGVLFGIILGQIFKWYVLVFAYVLAIILVLVCAAQMERSFLDWALQIVAVTVSIQIGYLVGSIASSASNRVPKGLKNLKGRRRP
jgi:hypothetical protein